MDPPRRKYCVYMGAAVLANIIKDNPRAWVTKEDYEEMGKNVVKRLGSTDI